MEQNMLKFYTFYQNARCVGIYKENSLCYSDEELK